MDVVAPDSWDVHFFDHQDDLYRLLIKIVGDADIAQDLVQDTYLRVSQKVDASEIANPRAYLFTIASNLGRDFLRKRNMRAEIPNSETIIENLPSNTFSHERRIYDRQRLAMVHEAITRLPAKSRKAFVLRKIDGLSTDEVAGKMGVSRNMVEKHLRKALALTRDYMKKNDH